MWDYSKSSTMKWKAMYFKRLANTHTTYIKKIISPWVEILSSREFSRIFNQINVTRKGAFSEMHCWEISMLDETTNPVVFLLQNEIWNNSRNKYCNSSRRAVNLLLRLKMTRKPDLLNLHVDLRAARVKKGLLCGLGAADAVIGRCRYDCVVGDNDVT